MDERSLEYFRLRERLERQASEQCSNAEARRVHDELARGYAVLIKQGLEGRGYFA